MFAPLQDCFAAALLDADRPVPAGLTSHTVPVPTKRFAVYRNNVAAGLINALRRRFPVVQRIVGEEFFAGMASVYAMAHPPRSRLLVQYGDDFADFIQQFPPASELCYLPDVARLEAARTRAHHAADAEPLAAERLATLPPASLPSLRLVLHPSVEVVRSRHPIVTIWAMNADELPLGPIIEDAAEDALVVRPAFTIEVRKLPPGGAAFVLAIAKGAALSTAEHVFPALLVVGLATRFAALALLVMTLIIQIFVYPDAWPTHGTWAACFLILMAYGPGRLSMDWLLDRQLRSQS